MAYISYLQWRGHSPLHCRGACRPTPGGRASGLPRLQKRASLSSAPLPTHYLLLQIVLPSCPRAPLRWYYCREVGGAPPLPPPWRPFAHYCRPRLPFVVRRIASSGGSELLPACGNPSPLACRGRGGLPDRTIKPRECRRIGEVAGPILILLHGRSKVNHQATILPQSRRPYIQPPPAHDRYLQPYDPTYDQSSHAAPLSQTYYTHHYYMYLRGTDRLLPAYLCLYPLRMVLCTEYSPSS